MSSKQLRLLCFSDYLSFLAFYHIAGDGCGLKCINKWVSVGLHLYNTDISIHILYYVFKYIKYVVPYIYVSMHIKKKKKRKNVPDNHIDSSVHKAGISLYYAFHYNEIISFQMDYPEHPDEN